MATGFETKQRVKQSAKFGGPGIHRVRQVLCRRCGQDVPVGLAEAFSSMVCPHCRAAVVVPVQLDQFQLTEILGKGSMGCVYRAFDQTLRRHVAIKMIRCAPGTGPGRTGGCVREARALAALNHPNVVQVFSIDEAGDHPYIVMELVDGGRLDTIINEDAPLNEARALQIIIDVAEGLRAALGVGIIHGDVKPANILLDDRGVAKLVDFGVARFTHGGQSNRAYGTPHYVAPEIVLKNAVDHRADQFSLGATLYQALTAKTPFEGQTVDQVLKARIQAPVPDVRRVRSSLHPETAAVVGRMLQTDPDSRYLSYEDLLTALREALETTVRGPAQPDLFQLHDALEKAKPVRRKRVFKARTGRRPILLMTLVALVLGTWIVGTLWWNARQRAALRLPADQEDPLRWISLMKLVDVDRHVVAGTWSWQDDDLSVAASEAARLSVPFSIRGNYEARIRFSRQDGNGGVGVFLPVGEHQVMVVLGAEDGQASGLQWIDQEAIHSNGTGVVAGFANQRPYTVGIRIESADGQATIEVDLQDQPVVRWSGRESLLNVRHPWTQLDSDSLGLGASGCDVAFHSIQVRRRPNTSPTDASTTSGAGEP